MGVLPPAADTSHSAQGGRIRWTSDTVKGVGLRKKDRFVGHTYRGPYRWTGRWQQKVTGSWKHLRWIGWLRTAGPTRH